MSAAKKDGDQQQGQAVQRQQQRRDQRAAQRRTPGRPPAYQGCQVCGADLSNAKRRFYQRYHICEEHMMASSVLVDGVPQRFCQQCGRFHELHAFDPGLRSCRAQLARHAERRRHMRAQAAAHRQHHHQRCPAGRSSASPAPLATSQPTAALLVAPPTPLAAAPWQPVQWPPAGGALLDSLAAFQAVAGMAAVPQAVGAPPPDCVAWEQAGQEHHIEQQQQQQQPPGKPERPAEPSSSAESGSTRGRSAEQSLPISGLDALLAAVAEEEEEEQQQLQRKRWRDGELAEAGPSQGSAPSRSQGSAPAEQQGCSKRHRAFGTAATCSRLRQRQPLPPAGSPLPPLPLPASPGSSACWLAQPQLPLPLQPGSALMPACTSTAGLHTLLQHLLGAGAAQLLPPPLLPMLAQPAEAAASALFQAAAEQILLAVLAPAAPRG